MKKITTILISILLVFLVSNGICAKKPTKMQPLIINEQEKTITYLAKVNGKYFSQGTRHASVYEKGSNGAKSIFTSLVDQNEFYNALIKIGAKPGNNMTMLNRNTTHVKGSNLIISVNWEGAPRPYTFDEIINDSNGLPIIIRFGGNKARAKSRKTGCLICLDSCPVGVASNATYAFGAVKRAEVSFLANEEILPTANTLVYLTIGVK
jgi:hypothetical protein